MTIINLKNNCNFLKQFNSVLGSPILLKFVRKRKKKIKRFKTRELCKTSKNNKNIWNRLYDT